MRHRLALGVLAAPAAALGGLIGFATQPGGAEPSPAAVCAAWAREYRDARNDLAEAMARWREGTGPDGRHMPRPDDLRVRVEELALVRLDGCNLNGHLTR